MDRPKFGRESFDGCVVFTSDPVPDTQPVPARHLTTTALASQPAVNPGLLCPTDRTHPLALLSGSRSSAPFLEPMPAFISSQGSSCRYALNDLPSPLHTHPHAHTRTDRQTTEACEFVWPHPKQSSTRKKSPALFVRLVHDELARPPSAPIKLSDRTARRSARHPTWPHPPCNTHSTPPNMGRPIPRSSAARPLPPTRPPTAPDRPATRPHGVFAPPPLSFHP